jgi:hypothetical protein
MTKFVVQVAKQSLAAITEAEMSKRRSRRLANRYHQVAEEAGEPRGKVGDLDRSDGAVIGERAEASEMRRQHQDEERRLGELKEGSAEENCQRDPSAEQDISKIHRHPKFVSRQKRRA